MTLFDTKAPRIMVALMRDLGLADFQAGGILGNFGHESAGLADLVQGTVMNPRDMSGNAVGWPQWDGTRKTAFLNWCKAHGLAWDSDEANYVYFVLEANTSEKASIAALRATKTLKEATEVFERKNERPGVVALASREKWAERAMAAYSAAPKPITPIFGGGSPTIHPTIRTAAPTAAKPASTPVAQTAKITAVATAAAGVAAAQHGGGWATYVFLAVVVIAIAAGAFFTLSKKGAQ